jgi:hypothetical protein
VLGAAATAVYVPYAREAPGGPRGSTAVGLGFGIAAATLMAFEWLLNARKRVPTWNLGRAETWLKGHIWLGALAVPLAVFHSGFRLGGSLAAALMIVFALVVLSGVLGLVLQQFLPRLMTVSARGETIYEQIPHVIQTLRLDAYEVVSAVCGPIEEAAEERAQCEAIQRDPRRARHVLARQPASAPAEGSAPLRHLYRETVRPFLMGDGRHGPLADARETEGLGQGLLRLLPPALHEAARDLLAIAAERRDYAVQARLHRWLHGWLLVHVPLSAALLVLLIAHAVFALRYTY